MFDVISGYGFQESAALKAPGETLARCLKAQLAHNLAYLPFRVVGTDEKGSHPAAPHDSPLEYVGVTSQNYSLFGQTECDHVAITLAIEEYGIVAQESEPLRQFPNIRIDNKSHFVHRQARYHKD